MNLVAIPKIATSAQLNKKEEHYLESGFQGFIAKPINVETFETQLLSFL